MALAAAAALLVVAVLLAVGVGAVGLAPGRVVATLLHRAGLDVGNPLDGVQAEILLQLRLPRVLLVALVGGVLAVAGAAYQGVFRNPLADPYLLGAAAGAGLGATLVIAYAPRSIGPFSSLPAAAFAGALTGVGLAYLLGSLASRTGGGGAGTLLLAGVAVTSFLTAVQTFVQQAHTNDLLTVYSWILGQLGDASWSQLGLVLPYVVVAVAVLLGSMRALDVLAVGDDEAATLGLRPKRIRFVVLHRRLPRHRGGGRGQRAHRLRRPRRAPHRPPAGGRLIPDRRSGLAARRRGLPRHRRPHRPDRGGAGRTADRGRHRVRGRAVLRGAPADGWRVRLRSGHPSAWKDHHQ